MRAPGNLSFASWLQNEFRDEKQLQFSDQISLIEWHKWHHQKESLMLGKQINIHVRKENRQGEEGRRRRESRMMGLVYIEII